MRKRIRYSQNFLKDKNLIKDLIEKSQIKTGDLVYEIGAGQGIITDELLKKNVEVVAFEIDLNLCNKLKERYNQNKHIQLVNSDFLLSTLPSKKYKVFSNIPFNITSSIIKKLTFDDNPPEVAYLIVQKEASMKFIGKPIDNKNSLLAVLIKSQFEASVFHEFSRRDFYPIPSVDVVMIKIQRNDKDRIEPKNVEIYYDFVAFTFNQFEPNIFKGLSKVMPKDKIVQLSKQEHFSLSSKPSELELKCWFSLFDTFLKSADNKDMDKIKGTYSKLLDQQEKLNKINRTRLDRNWNRI